MKCIDCKFFVPRNLDEFQKKFFPKEGVGMCHRYPLKEERNGDHWCGEFKPKEKPVKI